MRAIMLIAGICQSGDGPTIPLLEAGSTPDTAARWKVVEKMNMITQYAFAGDYTGACGGPVCGVCC